MEPNVMIAVVGAVSGLAGTLITGLIAHKTTLFQGKQRGQDVLLDSLIKEKAELQNKLDAILASKVEESKNAPETVQRLRAQIHERDLKILSMESEKKIVLIELEQERQAKALWHRRCNLLYRKRKALEAELAKAQGDTSGSSFTRRTAGARSTEASDLIVLPLEDREQESEPYDEMDSQAIEDDLSLHEDG
jgi:hypothetical protein